VRPDAAAHPPHLSLLLGLLSTVGAFSIDAFFPALRAIAQAFHLSSLQAQQTLTVYMLGYALASLLQQGFSSPPIYLQQLLLAALGFGLQLMYPVVTLRILDLFPHSRGAAASMQSFFNMIIATLTMGLVAPVLAQSMRSLAWGSLGASALGWLLWQRAQRYRAAHRA
jgi:MFS family permease